MKVTVDASKFLQLDDLAGRQMIAQYIEQVSFILNGNVGLTDNLKAEFIQVRFVAAGFQSDVRHSLGRKAIGYIPVRRSASITIYDGSSDWNENSIFLRASGAGVATVMVF